FVAVEEEAATATVEHIMIERQAHDLRLRCGLVTVGSRSTAHALPPAPIVHPFRRLCDVSSAGAGKPTYTFPCSHGSPAPQGPNRAVRCHPRIRSRADLHLPTFKSDRRKLLRARSWGCTFAYFSNNAGKEPTMTRMFCVLVTSLTLL